MYIEPIVLADRATLIAIAIKTGLFTLEEAESLLGGILDGFAASSLPIGYGLACCRDKHSGLPVG
jgi:hypothetical protein